MAFAIAMALGLWETGAMARDEPCATISARAPADILLPLTDAPSAPVAVSIALGETLCVTGTLGAGGVMNPRLTDAQRGDQTFLRLRLEPGPEGPTLRLRNSTARVASYSVAVVSGPANLAVPTRFGMVPPGTERVGHFGPGVRRLLVYSVSLREPQRPVHYVPERWVMIFASALAEARRFSATPFDQPLRASGYGALPRTFPGLGFVVGFDVSRWRFELPFFFGGASTGPAPDGSTIGARITEARVDAGYEFLRWRGLTGFALGEIGVTSFSLDARGAKWTYVVDHASNLGGAGSVGQAGSSLGIQAGFEQFVPFRTVDDAPCGLLVSLRGGYLGQFADAGWATDGEDSRSVGGLPAVNTSGAWISLNVGFAAEFTRWKRE